ncbi:MAG: CPBP family intramembrane metalloprotease [Ruminococcus sp.]|nr:CPBP family intramembrane metalloprotease [Ruminococcus sp.]
MNNISNVYQQRQPMPPPNYAKAITPEIAEKRRFKGVINYMSAGLLGYSMILYGSIVGFLVIQMIMCMVTSHSSEEYNAKISQLDETMTESAGSMIVGVILGCIFLMLFFIKKLPVKEIIAPHRKMTAKKLVMLICVLMGCQFVFSITESIIESLLNLAGFTAEAAIESSKAGSTTISMMIYAGYIGPLAEELTYRGYTMHSLQKGGGKIFAIIVSSILFGVMHANITQSLFAMGVGIVFAYTAIEYGIIWSLVLHIANNFLFGDCIVFLEKHMPETAATILDYTIFIGFFVAAVAIVIYKRKTITRYIKANRTPAKYYNWTFSSVPLIIFIGLNILLAVMTISKLK